MTNANPYWFRHYATVPGHVAEFICKHGDGRITERSYQRYTQPGPGTVVTVTHLGNIVGLIGFVKRDGEATSLIIVVHKQHRNKGLGKELVRRILIALRVQRLDCKIIVAEDNEPSKNVFQAHGLQVTETLERRRDSGVFTALVYLAATP